MGQSLSATVFYGARLPGEGDDGPRVRGLTAEAAVACMRDADDVDYREDWQWALESHHPLTSKKVEIVRSGVGDYTTPHIAAIQHGAEWYGIGQLPALEVDPGAHEAVVNALAALEWEAYDDDAGEYRPCAPPEPEIGWWFAASYW